MQFFAQQWLKSGYCNQFHTYSQWFAVNFIISKISITAKCSKCLKYSVFNKITVSGMTQGIPMQFFTQHTMMKLRLLWIVSHIFTVVSCKFYYFKNFNSWKMLKMLKIGCFNQNYCISGTPQGTPMQFFPQQWWKSSYCDQFHTCSQWFAYILLFQKFQWLQNAENA